MAPATTFMNCEAIIRAQPQPAIDHQILLDNVLRSDRAAANGMGNALTCRLASSISADRTPGARLQTVMRSPFTQSKYAAGPFPLLIDRFENHHQDDGI